VAEPATGWTEIGLEPAIQTIRGDADDDVQIETFATAWTTALRRQKSTWGVEGNKQYL
jgi:hypothetical protein